MLDLLLGPLDAPLDLADVLEVLVQPRAIAGAEAALQRRQHPRATESRMLRSSRIRARRCAAVPGRPNIRSNTTRGLISIGSGVVGVCQEIVFM